MGTITGKFVSCLLLHKWLETLLGWSLMPRLSQLALDLSWFLRWWVIKELYLVVYWHLLHCNIALGPSALALEPLPWATVCGDCAAVIIASLLFVNSPSSSKYFFSKKCKTVLFTCCVSSSNRSSVFSNVEQLLHITSSSEIITRYLRKKKWRKLVTSFFWYYY